MCILNNSRVGGTPGVLNFIGTYTSVCRLSTELYCQCFVLFCFYQNCFMKCPVSRKYLLCSEITLELCEHLLVYDFKTSVQFLTKLPLGQWESVIRHCRFLIAPIDINTTILKYIQRSNMPGKSMRKSISCKLHNWGHTFPDYP